MLVQEHAARLQMRAAMRRYHLRYDNELYRKATAGKSVAYANALIDEALAICGHPHYRLSRRRWAVPARVFLLQFRVSPQEEL
jgi:predicted urease superfamily metal-dependent hydrolase